MQTTICVDLDTKVCNTELDCYQRTQKLVDVDWRLVEDFGLQSSAVKENESPECIVRHGGCAGFTQCRDQRYADGFDCCQEENCNLAIFKDPYASTTTQSAVLNWSLTWM